MPPAPPDMRRVERLLIVKLSSIGDMVHGLPLSAALGEAFPAVKLSWVVEERSAPMVLGNPYLEEVIVLPDDWHRRPLSLGAWKRFAALRRDLRSRRFDVALDAQGRSRSAFLAWASGARYRFGHDWQRQLARLLTARVARRPGSAHVVEQLLDVARFLGAPVAEVKFPLHIPGGDEDCVRQMLETAEIRPDEPFLTVNPTEGGSGRKGWGAARLAALLEMLARQACPPVVLVGGPGDHAIGAAIQERVRPRPVSLIGRTSLKQLAAVLRLAALHVSGDTASAHIAAALGTPVVCFFGRTNAARSAPYGQESYTLNHWDRCGTLCRWYHQLTPLNSHSACFARTPICLASTTVEEVAALIRQRMVRPHGLRGTPVGCKPCAGELY